MVETASARSPEQRSDDMFAGISGLYFEDAVQIKSILKALHKDKERLMREDTWPEGFQVPKEMRFVAKETNIREGKFKPAYYRPTTPRAFLNDFAAFQRGEFIPDFTNEELVSALLLDFKVGVVHSFSRSDIPEEVARRLLKDLYAACIELDFKMNERQKEKSFHVNLYNMYEGSEMQPATVGAGIFGVVDMRITTDAKKDDIKKRLELLMREPAE